MKVRELIEQLQGMDPELPVYIPCGQDRYGPLYAEADFTGLGTHGVMSYPDPARPFYSEPTVIQIAMIKRYW